ncbi:hypothetical protein KKD61_00680 [Patescibacteria group bacterium]|nr:hypothetical protein [Patescibacteria group bacterium]
MIELKLLKPKNMSGESSEIPIKDSSKETIRGITYERIPFPTEGRFVRSFLEAHPEIALTRDLWPDLIETNRSRPEATILFAGFKRWNTEGMMRGRTVHKLAEQLDDTIGFIDWMTTTHIEELVARGLADHFEDCGYQGVKLFGVFHRGYFALRLTNTHQANTHQVCVRLTHRELFSKYPTSDVGNSSGAL